MIKQCALVVGTCLMVASVSGENNVRPAATAITNVSGYVTLIRNDVGGESSLDQTIHWSDGLVAHSGTNYLVQGNSRKDWFPAFNDFQVRTWTKGNTTFLGDSLTLDNGTFQFKMANNGRTTVSTLNAYGCHFLSGVTGVNRLGGTLNVFGTSENPTTFTVSSVGGDRSICVDSKLVGGSNAVICVQHTPNLTGDSANKIGRVYFDGPGVRNDLYNPDYAGRWRVCGNGKRNYPIYLDFWQQAFGVHDCRLSGKPLIETFDLPTIRFQGSALTNGEQIVANGDLILEAYSGRSLSGRFSNEGLYVAGGARISSTNGGELIVQTSSASSAAASFGDVEIDGFDRIRATSTLRLNPLYNQPQMPILVDGGGIADSCDHVGPVTLGNAGSISAGVGNGVFGVLQMESLTCSNSAAASFALRYSVAPLSDSVLTADVYRVKGDFVNVSGSPMRIGFEDFPQLPSFGAGTVYPIFSASNFVSCSSNDFELAGVDGNTDLPHMLEGQFEIRPIEGRPTLVFVQSSPGVVKLMGQDASSTDSFASAGKWNNGFAPSSAFNYLLPAGSRLRCLISGRTFAGHTLSIVSDGDLALAAVKATINDLRLYKNAIVSIRQDGTTHLFGTVAVHAPANSPASIWGYTKRTFNLEARITGEGRLRMRHYADLACPNTPCFYANVKGDNAAFSGSWELYQPAVVVDFANQRAMGGPAAAFMADRIRFTSNAVWRCSSSFTVDEPTFGITMGVGNAALNQDGGTFQVEPNQTLTLGVPIAGSTTLRKTGAGELVLQATNTFSGTVRLNAGRLTLENPSALANATLVAAEDATLVIATDVGAVFKSAAAFATSNAVPVVSSSLARLSPFTPVFEAELLRLKGTTNFDTSLVDLDWGVASGRLNEIFTVADGKDLLVKIKTRIRGTAVLIR